MNTTNGKQNGNPREARKMEIHWRDPEEVRLRVRNAPPCKGVRADRAQTVPNYNRITVLFTEGPLLRVIQQTMRKEFIC